MSDDDWKVGDEVVIYRGWGRDNCSIGKVCRLTATQVLVGDENRPSRFSRKDGYEVGASTRGFGARTSISRDPEDVAKARVAVRRSVIVNGLSNRFVMTQESVMQMRGIARLAEAFLREIGEWKDEANAAE